MFANYNYTELSNDKDSEYILHKIRLTGYILVHKNGIISIVTTQKLQNNNIIAIVTFKDCILPYLYHVNAILL